MIKIISILLLIPCFCIAQETSTIKVIGRAIHIDDELNFEATIILSTSYSSEKMSITQMKSIYNEALNKKGLSLADLKEDPRGYLYSGYEKEGVVYLFQTTSLDKFDNFLASKSVGLQRLAYGYSIVISEKEASLAASKAIKNAKEKAQITAKSANKKLGDIVYIEDNNLINLNLRNQPLYYNSNIGQYIYDLTVTFELKDK